MDNMIKFNKIVDQNIERLGLYAPIVERVHGAGHPEFIEVRKIFNDIDMKIKEAGSLKPELEKEFKSLRKITDNYAIPTGVCESYEAVYKMLSELDKAYHDSEK